MDVTAAAASAGTSPTKASNTTDSVNTVLTSDFETFLKMLTAQARYQDPLDPIDNSEYAAQLAQFSMVEQQVATNKLIENLANSLGVNQTDDLVQWIGKEVLTDQPAYFDGSPISMLPSVPADASVGFLVVRDITGAEVYRAELDDTPGARVWDGTRSDGSTAPNGTYRFEVEPQVGAVTKDPIAVPTYSRIVEARLDKGTTQLVLASGSIIDASGVQRLREPAT